MPNKKRKSAGTDQWLDAFKIDLAPKKTKRKGKKSKVNPFLQTGL